MYVFVCIQCITLIRSALPALISLVSNPSNILSLVDRKYVVSNENVLSKVEVVI